MTKQEEYQARLDDAIALMRRVIAGDYGFNMLAWISLSMGQEIPDVYREDEMHRCGTGACFGGWLAASSGFQQRGGHIRKDHHGPCFNDNEGPYAIAEYFGWSDYFARVFTGNDQDCERFYGVNRITQITPEMVLSKLLKIKAGKIDTDSEEYA